MTNAAKDVLPQKEKRNVKQVWKDDPVLNDLLERKALCNRKSIEHKQLSKQVKSRIRKIRNDKVSAEANELNTYDSIQATRYIWWPKKIFFKVHING